MFSTGTVRATKALLDDAQSKYHQLQTGTMARVVVDQNGERVEFTAASRSALYSYIQELQMQLGCEGPNVPTNLGPAGVIF